MCILLAQETSSADPAPRHLARPLPAGALGLWVLGFFVQRVVPLIERQLLRPGRFRTHHILLKTLTGGESEPFS